MSEFDPLSDLWQKQDVQVPDSVQLQKQWQKMRVKQMFYALADVLAVLFAMAANVYLFLFKPESHWLIKVWAVAMLLVSVYCTYKLLQLRKPAWNNTEQSTEQYLILLTQQCQNNIKIAGYSLKILIWIDGLVLLFLLLYWQLAQLPPEVMLKKVIYSTVFVTLFSLGFYVWAKKHKHNNQQQLTWLKAQERENNQELS